MSSAVYSAEPPRALVTFTDILAGAATIIMYRTAEGRTEEVRGGTDLSAATPFAMDYEVAIGVLNTWRAQMFAADGTDLGFTGQVSVDVPASAGTWLQQPLDPASAIRVRLSIDTGASMRKPTDAELTYAEGAKVGTLIGSQRQGIRGMKVKLFAELADLPKIDAMFGGYTEDFPSVLLLRTPPPLRIPRVFFMGIPDPEEFRHGIYALSGFTMTVDEVAAPYAGLVQSVLRRDDIDVAYATRAARAAAYATRQQRDQDYSLAGLAG